jgi:Mor family transcriptional regulator
MNTDIEVPETLQDFILLAARIIKQNQGASPDELARLITIAQAKELGGFYFPRGASFQLDLRDFEILEAFHFGPLKGNTTALARKYHVSERHIRRLLKRAIKKDVMKRQMTLLSEPETPPNRR